MVGLKGPFFWRLTVTMSDCCSLIQSASDCSRWHSNAAIWSDASDSSEPCSILTYDAFCVECEHFTSLPPDASVSMHIPKMWYGGWIGHCKLPSHFPTAQEWVIASAGSRWDCGGNRLQRNIDGGVWMLCKPAMTWSVTLYAGRKSIRNIKQFPALEVCLYHCTSVGSSDLNSIVAISLVSLCYPPWLFLHHHGNIGCSILWKPWEHLPSSFYNLTSFTR